MSDPIYVVVPPPIEIGVVLPGTPTEPVPPVIVGPGQGGAIGPQGIQGVQGVQGIQGAVDTRPIAYTHMQMGVSDTWVVTHNLNFYPNVTVVDSGGTIVEGEINYLNSNALTLTFSAGFSGNAYLS